MGRDTPPILEFDPSTEAIIEPSHVFETLDVPEHAVVCFFQDVIAKVCGAPDVLVHTELSWESGTHPMYEVNLNGSRLVVLHPGVGAALAGALLEEAIAVGCRKFIACGGAGALVPDLPMGITVVPTGAVRDEGTSYHYLPAAEEALPSAAAVSAIEATLTSAGLSYVTGKTWTTDAPYRETREKLRRRRDEGCITVEMEAAALFAVAAFRGVTFGQLLYAGDTLATDDWDDRSWVGASETREKLFLIAAEACLIL